MQNDKHDPSSQSPAPQRRCWNAGTPLRAPLKVLFHVCSSPSCIVLFLFLCHFQTCFVCVCWPEHRGGTWCVLLQTAGWLASHASKSQVSFCGLGMSRPNLGPVRFSQHNYISPPLFCDCDWAQTWPHSGLHKCVRGPGPPVKTRKGLSLTVGTPMTPKWLPTATKWGAGCIVYAHPHPHPTPPPWSPFPKMVPWPRLKMAWFGPAVEFFFPPSMYTSK